ncbi:electron transporter RnfG [Methanosarcina sp. 1.H.T.1A.1]|uniref:Rnf electron transport complex subunit RnfG n=1 Tax=unclassified Methanosarcina TaxID=2644672 RepID=UPI0006227E80|nr:MULTISPECIES: Rnf electron transport complex subunit RnfG [unclassified Methanosarcina]KKH47961.1 electron transporter RnfG [Methanosarcina sp. 1.H.A.2.2]KKH92232.1 electron transporter RnfG [Methanosarcina sp. 1.H.T.1A.1]
MKNTPANIIIKMIVLSALAAVLLAVTFVPTQVQLGVLQAEQEKQALKAVLPAAADFEPVYGDEVDAEGNPVVLYFRGVDSSGNIVGYAFRNTQPGAQGLVELLGGVSADFNTVTGMEVMAHAETPGLGAKITEPGFKSQFINLPVADLSLSKDGGKVDAISGATISTVTVVNALHFGIDGVRAQEG